MHSIILFFDILFAATVVNVHACHSLSRDNGCVLKQRQHSKAPILDHILNKHVNINLFALRYQYDSDNRTFLINKIYFNSDIKVTPICKDYVVMKPLYNGTFCPP